MTWKAKTLRLAGWLGFLWISSFAPLAAAEGTTGEARLLRFPDIHDDFVVFVYAGDVWRAPVAGGEARRLTSHAGQELFPKISPDGRWVAYSAENSGSRQVWLVPAEGGEPRQLTFYTDVGPMPPRGGWDNWILGWTADGKILVRMNRTPWSERMGRYFTVDPAGGLETPLILPEGGSASLSPDGTKIAYTPVDREFRTWKRTRGGRAQDVWIYDFAANRSERLTDDPGTDNFPMWVGETIYFTSDREDTLNLFAYDLESKKQRKLTQFETWDVLWPSLGPGAIVFMNGGYLYRFDLATEKSSKIDVRISTELPATVPAFKQVGDFVQSADLSPTGARAVFSARGELFTVPAKNGPTRNLSRTQGVAERFPAWSPDGRWIAYLSDATGEYELYLRAQDGSGEPRQLTKDGGIWRFAPVWSPDSKKLAFGDRGRRLWILDVDTAQLTEADRSTQGDLAVYTFSPDSRWLAYEKGYDDSLLGGIALYSLEQKRSFQLGDGLTNDTSPVWSHDGKAIFFLSSRDYSPTFSDFEFDFVYTDSTRIYAATLDPSAPALFPPKSDEEKPAEDNAAAAAADKTKDKDKGKTKAGEKDADKPKPEPVKIEPAGFAARTVALPGLAAGNYASLRATEGALYYLKPENPQGGPASLYRYDLAERKEALVAEGILAYSLSHDGQKLLLRNGGGWVIAGAAAGTDTSGKLDLGGLRIKLDPRAEWRQIFHDGWRLMRDYFYDPAMHGYDWKALGERYGQLVEHVSTRSELDFVFGELVSELEAGHTYVASGDEPQVDRVEGGMLGCELELDAAAGRYRITKIYQGENWDPAYRSPLTEPGVDAKVGDYLLAIDGEALRYPDNPYRLLEGKAGQQVTLQLAAEPSGAAPRTTTVVAIGNEGNLRYLDWVKTRMELVDRLSGGKIGYLHLPDTALDGNRMLQKLFYGQTEKAALIVDDRYNGGGFIPDRMISYLARKPFAYWAQRDVRGFRTPGFAHAGPKAMLINGYSSSGGDALPFFFRQQGLGKLIGTRTWGGLIGLTGAPPLVDGGAVLPPTFRIYDPNGRWVVENEGVSPDVEIVDLPEVRIKGGDPSIEKAVELLLEELAQDKGAGWPAPPANPNLAAPSPRR